MAINLDLLIGADSLKELSYIDSNVDDDLLKVAIIRTQDNEIEPILGTPLFKKLLSDVNTGSITGVYQTLLEDYVIKYLVPRVEISFVPHLNVEMRNKAVGKSSDETITASSDSEVYSLGAKIQKDSQVYKRRLLGYLCDQYEAGNLPEYGEATTDAEEIAPIKKLGNTSNMSFL